MKYFENNYLQALNALSLQLLGSGRSLVSPAWTDTAKNTDFTRLYYVTAGEAVITTSCATYRLTPGNWYLLPAGYSFDYCCPHQMDHIYFHLKLCTANGFDLLRSCREPLSLPAPPQALFLDAVQQPDLLFGLLLRQALYSVLTEILTAHSIVITRTCFSTCVEQALVYINHHLRADLTIDQIAEEVFVSRSTLTKHFRKELGTSVNAYLHDALLSKGQELLVNSNLSIRQISEQLGYSDQFYFSRRFREKYGLPPQKYRMMPLV